MVSDGDVLEAAGDGGFGHLGNGVAAVAGGCVHVDVALDIGGLDEARQGMFGGGFDFAEVFAHLRWHPVHLEGCIYLFFGCCGDGGLVVEASERPFAQGVAHFEGALAKGDVVGLGAGEVLESCTV